MTALPEHDVRPYSVNQLAERWNCSSSMIRKLIKSGKLQAFRIGELIRIAAAEVVRFEGAIEEPALAPPVTPKRIERARRQRPPIQRSQPLD